MWDLNLLLSDSKSISVSLNLGMYVLFSSEANVIKHFLNFCNKLECMSLASLSSQV
jgi:hypothetical protein